jgi:anti-sigma regulatory factor (Ser/Thr protein kinase)
MAIRERAWDLVVPHDANGARQARQRLAADLAELIPPPLVADCVAVAAELLGNAVRHAAPLPGGVVRIACRVGVTDRDESGEPAAAVVELRVSDGGSPMVPTERVASPDSVDGRGLRIVAALARSWGVEREGDGQCVWAEVGGSASGGWRNRLGGDGPAADAGA